MVRLADLHPAMAEGLLKLDLPEIEPAPWIQPKPLAQSTIALITTAGLSRRGDRPFQAGDVGYRLIPGGADPGELSMSHASIAFDRSGFRGDPNVVFPIERLRELAADGEIGAVAPRHYSFMGAQGDPAALRETGEEIGRLLRGDGVDAALLTPV